MFDDIRNKYEAVNVLVKAIDDKKTTEISKFLGSRINNPESYIVMLGETSSGKSTLLNGLLGGNYLYTSVKSSTSAITELVFKRNEVLEKYYAINKNATMEELSREDYLNLSKHPDNNLSRLRLETKSNLNGMGSLRLFDTPGYGSIIEKHEEVLTEFLPESNLVLYVVSYKVGFQQDDFNFLHYAKEIVRNDTEFVLIINRVADGVTIDERRIKEITGYVTDLLHYEPKVFLIPSIKSEVDEYPLPQCKELWCYVQYAVTSEKHKLQLKTSLDRYIFGLLEKCEAIIDKRVLAKQINDDDKKVFEAMVERTKNINLVIKDEIIEPTFSELIAVMPSKYSKVKTNIKTAIDNKIDQASKLRENEITVYINSHMLQYETKKQVDELRSYIDAKLNEMDRQINEKLNKEYAKIEQTIELHFSVSAAKMAKSILKKAGTRALESSLLSYFKQFAGRGGTGIANASKHLLKKTGDIFGKTFSRETHNKLASTLSKIGATSAKAVGYAVTVAIEIGFMIIDTITWQAKLKKSIAAGIEKWYDEVITTTQNDLQKLKDENIELLEEEVNGWISAIDTRDNGEITSNTDNIEDLKILLQNTKSELSSKYQEGA